MAWRFFTAQNKIGLGLIEFELTRLTRESQQKINMYIGIQQYSQFLVHIDQFNTRLD
jgi:hypothetical protein